MITAELITIGDEILSGHTVNTNAAFIGEQLTEIDCPISRETTVGDELPAIIAAIREAMARADVVLATGGLGPTHDDITRTAIVHALKRPLVVNQEALKSVEQFFTVRGRVLDEINKSQAMLPAGAGFVPNDVGTAVGIHVVEGKTHFFALPGVPAEMRPMITGHIVPFLQTLIQPTTARGVFYTTGIPESTLYETLRPILEDHPQVKVAFLPGHNGVKIRASASLGSTAESHGALEDWKTGIRVALGRKIYSEDEEAIESAIGKLLKEKKATLAVAESCTGGQISRRITDVPGSSEYFICGYVTYSNESKTNLLGVEAAVIEKEGAVSEAVARQMADGAQEKSGADYALAVTGIAGPGGGSSEKPVGLTYIALAGGGPTVCRKYQLGTERSLNRQRASQAALNMLRIRLLGES